ncbi:MAG: SAM-dependent methyltransferase [Cycloclasticus sp.]|nr:MAG: SAM-dependent methyltransferase [Cycloclasticus sp.]
MNFTHFPIVLNTIDEPCQNILGLIDQSKLNLVNIDTSSVYLAYQNKALTLVLNSNKDPLSISIDFALGKAKHRRLYGGGKNQPLPKACGVDKHPGWTIFDATAGLGKDSFVLASLGSQVTLCEQHPALYALLEDAKYRAQNDKEAASIVQCMTLKNHDSIEFLENINKSDSSAPDVIYIDPMYPERKKSAKIKKEMHVLQTLVGHSGEEAQLFETALKVAKHRVVVKRPKSASPLNNTKPSYTVGSVNTRYDVYVL